MLSSHNQFNLHILISLPSRCANDSSFWAPLPTNSTEITMESHFDEESNLESQVMFGHLKSTLAVRCLAKNEIGAVSREIKLVSNGKNTPTSQLIDFNLTLDVLCSCNGPSNEQCEVWSEEQ